MNDLYRGIFHIGKPPENIGRSILIIAASLDATLQNRNRVPPKAVPISKIFLGLSESRMLSSPLISSLICTGLILTTAIF